MKIIFAIQCNSTPGLHNIKFYATKELAQKQLSVMADERKYRMGVNCFNQEDNNLSFTFGWEDHRISYSIIEVLVEE